MEVEVWRLGVPRVFRRSRVAGKLGGEIDLFGRQDALIRTFEIYHIEREVLHLIPMILLAKRGLGIEAAVPAEVGRVGLVDEKPAG